MRNCCRRSGLELRRSRNGLKIDSQGSRGVGSAPLFALFPNLTTKGAVVDVPKGFREASIGI
eukprot:11124201-Alexandrium_andersonii.AAC.1